MDIIHFIIKYIPFWAIPVLMISAEFAYIYWLKSIKKVVLALTIISIFCLLSIIYYFWAGGPDQAVQKFIEFCNFLTR